MLHKYYPDEKPGFTSLEGFVDGLVNGLKAAGKDLTRTKLISALESINDADMGIGPEFKITYNSGRHTGFDTGFLTMVKDGQAVELTDWKQVMPRH